jgi:hypothetical protein
VRLVREHQHGYEMLRQWVRRTERDAGLKKVADVELVDG